MDPISVSFFDQVTLFSDLNQAFELHIHSDFVIMHKNPHRRKLIQWMRPVGCKDKSIDLKMSL